jgi:hypothetical protein
MANGFGLTSSPDAVETRDTGGASECKHSARVEGKTHDQFLCRSSRSAAPGQVE